VPLSSDPVPDGPTPGQRLATIERYRRAPDEVADADGTADPRAAFLAYASLRYGHDDGFPRWQRAADILAEHPEIRADMNVASACADHGAVSAALAADPSAAAREGGPFGWEPLLYLAYARHDPTISEEATLRTAGLLLDHGADPNAGYLWHGLVPPFTALTGALGGGEADQPAHPHGLALAHLLLARGADPNDGQTLYNRQFRTDDRHLVLLLEHGLGRGDGGPWRARLGHTLDAPAELIRQQLWWAIVHDQRDRVRLLVGHGADVRTPFEVDDDRPSWARTSHGRTPAAVAALAGCPELVDWLVEHGAARPPSEGVDGLIAAALAGDRPTVERLRAYAAEARAQRPGLVVWAAARRRLEAIPLLVELGFDVNALGRSDVPMEQQWETALHEAAGDGDVELARLLLDLGADPDLHDTRFDATPLGWARYFDRPATADLLEPLTR
jgi:ankyrin repeat protein